MAIRRLSEMSFELPGKKGQIDISGAGTTDWLIIDRHPDGMSDSITIGLSPTSGEGYVQLTNDSTARVLAGTAVPVTWSPGTVTVATLSEIPATVTAIRAVTTGAGQLTVQR